MTGEINMSKLDTKPELEEKKKTGTLPKLKFTDYAIERFISTFNVRRVFSLNLNCIYGPRVHYLLGLDNDKSK